jgi:hypothetical protein
MLISLLFIGLLLVDIILSTTINDIADTADTADTAI